MSFDCCTILQDIKDLYQDDSQLGKEAKLRNLNSWPKLKIEISKKQAAVGEINELCVSSSFNEHWKYSICSLELCYLLAFLCLLQEVKGKMHLGIARTDTHFSEHRNGPKSI